MHSSSFAPNPARTAPMDMPPGRASTPSTERVTVMPRAMTRMPASTTHMAARILPQIRARGRTETMSRSMSLELFSSATARTT